MPASKGSSMPSPTEMPPFSRAPLLAASMIPGPPPVTTAKPACARAQPSSSARAYIGSSGVVRAEPKTEIAGPSSARAPKPSTNSDWIRMTRHGSVCTQSLGPRESRSRWSVVLRWNALRRIVVRPRCLVGPAGISSFMSERLSGEPSAHLLLDLREVLERHELLLLVRQQGVAGAEVHRGDAEGAEAGHVGPSELRVRGPADSLHESRSRGDAEAGHRRRSGVGHLDLEPVEDLVHVRDRLLLGPVGRKAVVDGHGAGVRQDVARDAAIDEDRVEPLAVLQPVDDRTPRLVGGEPVEDRGGGVDRVDAVPGPSRVRPLAAGRDVDPQRALAAGLDDRVRGLHEDREVRLEQLGVAVAEQLEPVAVLLHLL